LRARRISALPSRKSRRITWRCRAGSDKPRFGNAALRRISPGELSAAGLSPNCRPITEFERGRYLSAGRSTLRSMRATSSAGSGPASAASTRSASSRRFVTPSTSVSMSSDSPYRRANTAGLTSSSWARRRKPAAARNPPFLGDRRARVGRSHWSARRLARHGYPSRRRRWRAVPRAASRSPGLELPKNRTDRLLPNPDISSATDRRTLRRLTAVRCPLKLP